MDDFNKSKVLALKIAGAISKSDFHIIMVALEMILSGIIADKTKGLLDPLIKKSAIDSAIKLFNHGVEEFINEDNDSGSIGEYIGNN